MKKMLLIPFNSENHLRAQVERKNKNIIKTPNIPIDAKAKIIRQTQMRQKRLKKVYKNETRPAITKDTLIQALPKTSRMKGSLLINHLGGLKGRVSWDPFSGEIIYDGVTVPGSNIKDLIGAATSQKKESTPQGWVTFARALDETGTPHRAISAPRRAQITREKDWSKFKWISKK
jgi:hypothetical protein